ncbi:MAG: propane monooxygenase coupling protein [Pseudonocardiales bacterium]|uniref:propane 2-monooxygenase effector subunit MimD n=1 Tax=Pseudonocardia sp. Cha107L01 TaxID=3457576 RepID=UPI0028C85C55|nr:propane monooxygenase coupling protein [Pseudonocardiales bacterium]MDT7601687.1 propane monooxygenase coupling protein [Pseudonocardiales bacterium]MDT7636190.1 propane monooxygenase coupling protein [Pseudonocardiales bacterium]MDT7645981.1 propane monooxygenase coupling protein [Pseudonocardiales bacterium]MDT7657659.1 propane monooxygenase coupling protein [Pseudonocardiales bacterium]
MTAFKTSESPFKSDNTASNKCGFTLMNNQVGAVVAEVLRKLDNVTVTPLPSMIRIDGTGRFDLVYADVDDAAGEEEGWFDAAEFEENMSTHYGRMVHLDDRTIMFANPEDAAEYIGFDLKATT